VIPPLGRLRQKDSEFKAILNHIERKTLSHKQANRNAKTKK
jgi:hypothetical protein